MTIVAGVYGATGGSSGDGSAATAVQLMTPQAVAVNPDGYVFIADTGNHKVLVVKDQNDGHPPSNIPNFLYEINTVAGTCNADGSAGFAYPFNPFTDATSATLNVPMSIAVHPISSDLYIADTENCIIRKVTSSGLISTVFGEVSLCITHTDNVTALSNTGNLFVAATTDVPYPYPCVLLY